MIHRTSPARRHAALIECTTMVVLVTVTATVVARALPSAWVADGVAAVFLGATWWQVWRRDDSHVRRAGLALGGLMVRTPVTGRTIATHALRSIALAMLVAIVTFGPFILGWRLWWGVRGVFTPDIHVAQWAERALGQFLVIALPEEAFYRGYVQSRFDDVFRRPWVILGARVGPGLILTSVVFALGHYATVPIVERLAVFFPSLLFGWLRARSRGIGASITYHGLCNLLSQLLSDSYRA